MQGKIMKGTWESLLQAVSIPIRQAEREKIAEAVG